MIHFIAALLTFVVMVRYAIMGADWITIGYGLNPWIAFPVALIAAYVSYWQTCVGVAHYQRAKYYQQRQAAKDRMYIEAEKMHIHL